LVKRLGVRRQTYVSADSVYALDISDYEISSAVMARPLIGLNPIGFCDPRIWPKQDVYAYSRYLDKLAGFSLWLLSRNYGVKIFSGEASVDVYALADLKERLQSSLSPTDVNEMFVSPAESVKDLLAEMSRFDFVVTSKFHGVVFSHLLQKPCIALSYHNKIDDLMRVVGQSEYCLNIETFDDEYLKGAFGTLVEGAEEVRAKCRQTAGSYFDALKAQFDELFIPENLQSRPHELELRTERHGVVLGGSSNERECAARRIGK
jgi:polysaccharide pyruvyl transferase WcaK-like protein